MRPPALKPAEDPVADGPSLADALCVSRAERLAELSRRVREGTMEVNAAFAAIERDPDEAMD